MARRHLNSFLTENRLALSAAKGLDGLDNYTLFVLIPPQETPDYYSGMADWCTEKGIGKIPLYKAFSSETGQRTGWITAFTDDQATLAVEFKFKFGVG